MEEGLVGWLGWVWLGWLVGWLVAAAATADGVKRGNRVPRWLADWLAKQASREPCRPLPHLSLSNQPQPTSVLPPSNKTEFSLSLSLSLRHPISIFFFLILLCSLLARQGILLYGLACLLALFHSSLLLLLFFFLLSAPLDECETNSSLILGFNKTRMYMCIIYIYIYIFSELYIVFRYSL